MAAIPELAPKGQDHLPRSSSVVKHVEYGPGIISYETFDPASTEVIRLSFKTARVTANGKDLSERTDLNGDGYTIKSTNDGDYVLRIRHTVATSIRIAA